MCFAAVVTGLLSLASTAISGYMQTKAQNSAALQQYSFQQQQQRLVNNAAVSQYNESIARQHLDEQRTAQGDFENAQSSTLQNQQRQAAAMANAGTAGITGTPLSLLFNDYQVSSGNIATNLQTAYTQLNQNLFFNSDSLLRQAQSTMNQATPAPPYLAKFSILPALMSGATSFAGQAFKGIGSGVQSPSVSAGMGGSGGANNLYAGNDAGLYTAGAMDDAVGGGTAAGANSGGLW